MENVKHILIVVDMQNDFIDGALKNNDAAEIVDKIADCASNEYWDRIYATLDTHEEDYLDTQEGRQLPIRHCIASTAGRLINSKIFSAFTNNIKAQTEFVNKSTFGSYELMALLNDRYANEKVEFYFVGTCTDICVLSNAIMAKAAFPESKITVLSDLCAGSTKANHNRTLDILVANQINIDFWEQNDG